VGNFSVRSCSIEQSLPSEGKQAQMLSGALTNWLQNRARSVFHCRTVNDPAAATRHSTFAPALDLGELRIRQGFLPRAYRKFAAAQTQANRLDLEPST
jgi:hypothetical protein